MSAKLGYSTRLAQLVRNSPKINNNNYGMKLNRKKDDIGTNPGPRGG